MVGWASEAATSRALRVGAVIVEIRRASTSCMLTGTGNGTPGRGVMASAASRAAISSANIGLPPDASRIRSTVYRCRFVRARSCRIRWIAPMLSGCRRRLLAAPDGRARTT